MSQRVFGDTSRIVNGIKDESPVIKEGSHFLITLPFDGLEMSDVVDLVTMVFNFIMLVNESESLATSHCLLYTSDAADE